MARSQLNKVVTIRVVDYMWSQRWGKCGFKSYTFDKLKSELRDYASYYPMMNTEEIIDWAKNCHYNVSIHAYDARYKKFA